MQTAVFPILIFLGATVGLAIALLVLGNLLNPGRPGRVKRMPYESGMDPVHDTRRRFDVRFHLLAIAFLVFDVELLFLYPWAVALHRDAAGAIAASATAAADGDRDSGLSAAAAHPARPDAAPRSEASGVRPVFVGGMVFLGLLALGFVYDWRRGILRWR